MYTFTVLEQQIIDHTLHSCCTLPTSEIVQYETTITQVLTSK